MKQPEKIDKYENNDNLYTYTGELLGYKYYVYVNKTEKIQLIETVEVTSTNLRICPPYEETSEFKITSL